MKLLHNFQGKSQYDPDILIKYRPSACGPVTAFVILRYLLPSQPLPTVNELYRLLGGTRIGLFERRFVRNMRKLLGKQWTVKACDVQEAKRQLDLGRPVAAKFDKWFRFQWRQSFTFNYHWVAVVGYEEDDNGLRLLVHDHGGRNRPSQVRSVPYASNRKIVSFIKFEPSKR